jgi:hypothetical protein
MRVTYGLEDNLEERRGEERRGENLSSTYLSSLSSILDCSSKS